MAFASLTRASEHRTRRKGLIVKSSMVPPTTSRLDLVLSDVVNGVV